MQGYVFINWAIMLLSFAVLIWLGYKSSTVVHEHDDEAGFLVAGRSLGAIVGASTVVATGFSSWGFTGSPGVAYQFGATELLGNFMFAPAMLIAVLFFASYLAKRAEVMGSCTIPEYAARLHGGGLGRHADADGHDDSGGGHLRADIQRYLRRSAHC